MKGNIGRGEGKKEEMTEGNKIEEPGKFRQILVALIGECCRKKRCHKEVGKMKKVCGSKIITKVIIAILF